MMYRSGTISLFISLVCIFSSGCFDNSDCSTNNDRFFKFQFLTDSGSIAPDVNLIASEDPQVIFSADSSLSSYQLPLNPFQDDITYIFETDTSTESINISYQRKLNLIHPDCGMETIYTLDTVYTTWSDRSRLMSEEILLNQLNFEIIL